jgi:glutathione synthase/RimK-type ligase-like ATP-grasp enzyme
MVNLNENNEVRTNPKMPENRRYNKIDYSIPILNFSSTTSELYKNSKAVVYNHPDKCKISADKVEFSKAYEGEKFLPKTVYSLKDIETLKLPIIAKPKDGNSAVGISVFEDYESAYKSELSFDLWCEKKELVTEFRVFVMDGKIIQIVERVHNQTETKNVEDKEPDEKIDFIYVVQDMDKFPHTSAFNRIKTKILNKAKLDFLAIDILMDVNGDFWVAEINISPGIGPATFYFVYKSYLKMAFGISIDPEHKRELSHIVNDYIYNMRKFYPKEYAKSIAPMEAIML